MSPATMRSARGRPATRPSLLAETDGRIELARWGPLAVPDRGLLARQSELAAPAKLAVAADGSAELVAEVLRVGAADAPKLVRGALDVARAWLAGAMADSEPMADDEDLASALAELPRAWAWERAGGESRYHVHATAFGESVRLTVESAPGGARVSARSALPIPAPVAIDAQTRFALEVNRRLRLARVGLAATSDEAIAVTWEAIAPAAVVGGEALSAAVEAVVRAYAATRRPLRALCHEQIARTFLDARKAAPRRRRVPSA